MLTDRQTEVLKHLKDSEYVSEHNLEKKLGKADSTIHNAIEALQEKGFLDLNFKITPLGKEELERHKPIEFVRPTKTQSTHIDRRDHNYLAITASQPGTACVFQLRSDGIIMELSPGSASAYAFHGTHP